MPRRLNRLNLTSAPSDARMIRAAQGAIVTSSTGPSAPQQRGLSFAWAEEANYESAFHLPARRHGH